MKIRCLHGYFIFEELKAGQISDFMGLFGVELVAKDNYYTFATLADAPDYAIAGGLYLDAPVTKTFEGKPWEIMRKNNLVYHFNNDLVLPIEAITGSLEIKQASNYFLATGLVLPGSLMEDGSRVMDYSAFYIFDQGKFKYTEISHE
jgi:hypothetical protein